MSKQLVEVDDVDGIVVVVVDDDDVVVVEQSFGPDIRKGVIDSLLPLALDFNQQFILKLFPGSKEKKLQSKKELFQQIEYDCINK